MKLFRSPDIAIDLGTATTRVAGGRDGLCLSPSIAEDVQALKRGVIVSLQAAISVLRPMMQACHQIGMPRLRVLACAPTDVSPLERHSVETCVLEAGASSVLVVPEPLAAAVGSGIDIGCKYAKFLVDFGDGVTDSAIIRDGQIVASLAERVGCSDLRRSVQRFAMDFAGIQITDTEAERVLRMVGLSREGQVICNGAPGHPSVCLLPVAGLHAGLHAELQPVFDQMLAPMKSLLHEISPSIGAEVIEDGIFLTGGGALLPGVREAVATESAIDTITVKDPLGAVIRGASKMLPFAAQLNLWKN